MAKVRTKTQKPERLDKIFDKYKYDRNIEKQSKAWFTQQVRALTKKIGAISTAQIIKQQKAAGRIVPGKLYLFQYDPKYKASLPYYDRFPLVFPYKATKEGFIGLNMHYLPPYYRVMLMQRLMDFASSKTLNESTKLKYSWSLIGGAARFKWAEPCIKQYLKNHVKSTMVEVPGNQWHTAMMLPTEKFVGASKSKVWGDSVR